MNSVFSRHFLRWSFATAVKSFGSLTSSSPLNHGNISTILSSCGRDGDLRLGSSLHASILKNPRFSYLSGALYDCNVAVVWNSLLHMYATCGRMPGAVKLFDEMPVRDIVSWNSIVSGFLRYREYELGFRYYKKMLRVEVERFDRASLTTVLSACDGLDFLGVNKMVHCLVVLSGHEKETAVGNALITGYFRCGCFDSAIQVFDEMIDRSVISWTAAISGLVQNDLFEESLNLFVQMYYGPVSPNHLTYLSALAACSGLRALEMGSQIHAIVLKLGMQSYYRLDTALMDMYSKCGTVEDALQIFESTEVISEISMTVLMLGLAQNGFEDEAIQIFVKMLKAGNEIDSNVVSAVLAVFGAKTSLNLGKQVHSLAVKKGFGANTFVSNGLINMYAKCGSLEESLNIFYGAHSKNTISWNSMIAAYARHGNAYGALHFYKKMESEGIKPTDVTFVSLLHACSHVGLVKRGMEFFESMQKDYGIKPTMEHYACVVEIFGRARLLKEAKSFIEGLPVKPGAKVWEALLGSCSFHGDSELEKYAADQLLLAEPDAQIPSALMANGCSSRVKSKDKARALRMMRKKGARKNLVGF